MSQNEFALAYQADAGPVVQEAAAFTSPLIAKAEALQVVDADSFLASGNLVLEMKKVEKAVDEKRLSMTRPLDAIKAQWMEFFRPYLDGVKKAREALEARRFSYKREKETEERRLREEALKEQERLRREAERRAARLEASGQQERADLARASVPEVSVPSVVAQEVPKVAGLHTRENWLWACAVCGEKDCQHLVLALPKEYLAVRGPSVGAVVRQMKSLTKIPGVRVWMEESSVAGRGGEAPAF